jgi:hypothetical protein
MVNEKIKAAILFLTILAIASGVSWALVNAQQPTQEQQNQPQTMPKLLIHEQIRDATMAYLGTAHPEAVHFMDNLNWSGGREETALLGAETYTYQSQGWSVTIKYPVVANPVYNITVDYSTVSDGASVPYSISWQGTWQDGCVTEASFIFAQ